jgi:hypothetical protein
MEIFIGVVWFLLGVAVLECFVKPKFEHEDKRIYTSFIEAPTAFFDFIGEIFGDLIIILCWPIVLLIYLFKHVLNSR